MLPLNGVRVLDLSRVLAGPYCAMLLGDLGAEVIKIERPRTGDDTRQWGPPFVEGESAYFLCCNRNKQSVTLNLQHPRGQELARELASQSDVLLENFLPGTLERFGLDYPRLRAANSRLVYCSITGFGQDGPYRDLPGYDIIVQGLAGVMSITGEPDGRALKVGVAIADITAGLFAANAILAALVARGESREGRRLDIALLDSTVAWLANVGANYLATGETPPRRGNAHPSIVPYESFAASDREFIVAVGNDAQWRRFCEAIDRRDLAADERFASNPQRVANRQELIAILSAVLRTRSADQWLRTLAEAEVPCGPVNTIDRTFADPQVLHRQMLVDVPYAAAGLGGRKGERPETSVRLAGSPFKFGDGEQVQYRAPPRLGEHTAEVLSNLLHLDSSAISALSNEGVV